MPNIKVSINDRTYRDVRVWCNMRNTSVSAVVQRFLEDLPHLEPSRRSPAPRPQDFIQPARDRPEPK